MPPLTIRSSYDRSVGEKRVALNEIFSFARGE